MIENIFISFTGGTGGNFISALLNCMKFPNLNLADRISNYGNAHECVVFDGIKQPEFTHVDDPAIVTEIVLSEPKKYPRIGRGHWTRIHELLCYFPNSKIIYIYSEPTERRPITFNIFFKKIVDCYDTFGRRDFINFLNTHKDLHIDTSLSPWEITKKQFLSIIERMSYANDIRWRQLLYNHPDILQVNFADIHYGNLALLEQLSSFTGLPVTENSIEFFKAYVDKQPKIQGFLAELKD